MRSRFRLERVEDGGPLLEAAGVHAEVRELAHKGIVDDLEGERREGRVHVRLAGGLVARLRLAPLLARCGR